MEERGGGRFPHALLACINDRVIQCFALDIHAAYAMFIGIEQPISYEAT